MGDQSTDFVTKFNALEGDTVSARKKNFYKLIKEPNFSANKQQIHDALDKLEPKTYLERCFKVDALIYFKYTARLFDIIQEGNEVFISKILKQPWFFKEGFENMDADWLVNNFLPCLSFVMRIKVLKKLSVVFNEEKMDEIYTFVYKRYGLWIAVKILHTCSKEKLETVFNSEEITLRVHQVLYLFKKNTDLFEMYIDYYKKTFDNLYNEPKINEYIALKNPSLFFKLKKQERICVSKLGRRTTKKVYDLIKDEVTKDFDSYVNVLYKPVLIKKMGSEFRPVYYKRFPKILDNIVRWSECRTLLRFYPKNRRWELFKGAFLARFPNLDIYSLYSNLGTNVNDLSMTRDIIVSWADYNYQTTKDEQFLKYLPPKKAISLIKEKINVTSDIYKRRNYVDLLLETCSETNDLTALEEVLQYICHRHRNEDAFFKRNVLANINNLFKLQDLNKNHWEKINEIIKILQIQNEFEFWRCSLFLRRHLEFLVKIGEDYKPQLIEYLKLTIVNGNEFKVSPKNPDVEKKLLSEMPEYFSVIFINKSFKDIVSSQMAYMKYVIDFSEANQSHYIDLGQSERLRSFFNSTINKYKNNQISQDISCEDLIEKVMIHKKRFPQCSLPLTYDSGLVDIVVNCRRRQLYHFFDALKAFVLQKSRDQFENQLLKAYFEKTEVAPLAVNWFLKNEPTILIPYWDKILQEDCELDLKILKSLTHFGFDKKAIDVSKAKLESDNVENYVNHVCVLRNLLTTNEFADWIGNSKVIPTKTKLDLEDVDMKKMYDIQCQIAKTLYEVEEPFKMFNVVLKFTVGDYLQSALPSLQALCYRSPEKNLYSHFDELAKKAVSVRKHAVFLSCELLNREYVMKMLASKDSNVSSQKHLFTASLKYFKKNPSQDLLDLVVKNMSTIDKNDTESLEGLVGITVPKKYKGFYIEKCWEFYEGMKSNGVNVDQYLENLLAKVSKHTDVLVALSSSFLDNIITNYWCTSLNNSILVDFILKALINSDTIRSQYLQKVFDKIKTANNKVGDFVDYLITAEVPRDFLLAFTEHWNEQFNLQDNFEEHITLKLLLFESNSVELKENLAHKIVIYLEELIEKFTFLAFDIFEIVFQKFITHKAKYETLKLLDDMIKFRPTAPICILILFVINPNYDDEDERLRILHQSIFGSIEKVEEPIVKIYLKKFKKLNSV